MSRRVFLELGCSASRKETSGAETWEPPPDAWAGVAGDRGSCRISERWLEWQDQPGEEDAPVPMKMETLVKVVLQLHKQWGIDCKPKDLECAVTRLLKLGTIDRPVEILHPECWKRLH